MRKLLSVIVLCLVVGSTASWAAFGAGGTAAPSRLALAGERGAAAVTLPAALPKRDAEHRESYGYRSSAAIAAALGAGAPAPAAPATATGATVTITATVLPVRTIVVEDGVVTEVWSNTDDLRARNSLYVVRAEDLNGPVVPLTADTWAQVRALLARSNEATGRIA